MELNLLPQLSPLWVFVLGLLVHLPLALTLQIRAYNLFLKIISLTGALIFPAAAATLVWASQTKIEFDQAWIWKMALILVALAAGHLPLFALNIFKEKEVRSSAAAYSVKTARPKKLSSYLGAQWNEWSLKIFRHGLLPLLTVFTLWGVLMPNSLIPFQLGEGWTWYMGPSVYPLGVMIYCIYTLYILERMYRYSQSYQRKIARLVYLALFSLALAPLPVMGRLLLYGSLGSYFSDSLAVVLLIAYPAMLMGLSRYRLGKEKISIPRETVTNSITLLLTGSVFMAVSATIIVVQALGFSFRFFEAFLLGFSLCFGALVVIGSGTTRRRLTQYLSRHLYTQKYDYYNQFFRLHKTFLAGEELEDALTDLVENMKYTLSFEDAVIYLHSDQDGNYHLRPNKEEEQEFPEILSGENPEIKIVCKTRTYVDFFLNPVSLPMQPDYPAQSSAGSNNQAGTINNPNFQNPEKSEQAASESGVAQMYRAQGEPETLHTQPPVLDKTATASQNQNLSSGAQNDSSTHSPLEGAKGHRFSDLYTQPKTTTFQLNPFLKMRANAIFALPAHGENMGLLVLTGKRKYPLSDEDLALIEAFAQTIGSVLFQNRVQRERIYQKQFESFHHIVSFIIHDIKNQVATLSLLVRNAEKNISNPAFQESMIRSVRNCADQLESLMGRLSVAPRTTVSIYKDIQIKPLISRVEENSALNSEGSLWKWKSDVQIEKVFGDAESLFFVLRNLIKNAQEAMPKGGELGIQVLPIRKLTDIHVRQFGGNRNFFDLYHSALILWDKGPGMNQEFMLSRLFKPFNTTKEKGVGIGLYQCKTLIEQMQGRLLCFSQPQAGTQFCILLSQGNL